MKEAERVLNPQSSKECQRQFDILANPIGSLIPSRIKTPEFERSPITQEYSEKLRLFGLDLGNNVNVNIRDYPVLRLEEKGRVQNSMIGETWGNISIGKLDITKQSVKLPSYGIFFL